MIREIETYDLLLWEYWAKMAAGKVDELVNPTDVLDNMIK